jgi:hypothetical protein
MLGVYRLIMFCSMHLAGVSSTSLLRLCLLYIHTKHTVEPKQVKALKQGLIRASLLRRFRGSAGERDPAGAHARAGKIEN